MPDVRSAAATLERRPSHEGVPYERYTDELWSLVDARLPGFGPSWLRQFSKDFRLGGACFELKVDNDSWTGHCIIPRPSSALVAVYNPYTACAIERLFKHQFVCFADGQDGYGWVFRDDGNPDPDVFFFEQSAWDGGEASERNGLLRVHMTFSELFSYGANSFPVQPAAK